MKEVGERQGVVLAAFAIAQREGAVGEVDLCRFQRRRLPASQAREQDERQVVTQRSGMVSAGPSRSALTASNHAGSWLGRITPERRRAFILSKSLVLPSARMLFGTACTRNKADAGQIGRLWCSALNVLRRCDMCVATDQHYSIGWSKSGSSFLGFPTRLLIGTCSKSAGR